MAMVVKNNVAAQIALGELNKNTNNRAKELKKISGGEKITGAKDDASGYSISEKMRVLVRALNQDIDNSKKGANLVKIAEGGIQSIVDELREMKAMAIDSANDHNSEVDRAILQKVFASRIKDIDDIASTTEYNGIPLLDGRWCKMRFELDESHKKIISSDTTSTTETSPTTSTTSEPSTTTQIIPKTSKTTTSTNKTLSDTPPTSTGITTKTPVTTSSTTTETSISEPVTTTKSDKTTETETTQDDDYITEVVKNKITTTSTTATTTTETTKITTQTVTETEFVSFEPVTVTVPEEVIIIKNGTTSITEDGIYEFAPDYSGTLTISASSVEIMGPSSGVTLNEVYLVDNGLDDLYLKNVKINNTQDKSAIAFDSSTKNTLHLFGSNSIYDWNKAVAAKMTATVNAGGGLFIVGNGTLSITHGGHPQGAMIGSDYDGTCGDIAIGQQVKITVVSHQGGANGAGIGSGGGVGSCGNISIGTGSIVNVLYDYSESGNGQCAAAIGAGNSFTAGSYPHCGNITVYSGATVSAKSEAGSGIGSSSPAGECKDITIFSDAKVDASSHRSPGIGAGSTNGVLTSKCGNITIYSYSSGKVTAKAYNKDKFNLTWYADDIGAGDYRYPNSIVGSVNLLNTVNNTTGGIADFSEPTLGETTKTQYEITTDTITKTETSISITKTSTTQYDTFTTVTDSITTTVFVIEPELVPVLQDPLIIHTGPRQNEELHIFINDMRPKAMGLSDVAINPLEKALEAIDKLDAALEYALNENTQMGAYQQRLNATVEGLIVSQENSTASESTIRDADMAKEMTDYTKANILTQSAQAMLAQANQSASSVLSLLQ